MSRNTLVWKGILQVFFSLSGYRRAYLGDGGTNRREILHDGTYRSRTDPLPFWVSPGGNAALVAALHANNISSMRAF